MNDLRAIWTNYRDIYRNTPLVRVTALGTVAFRAPWPLLDTYTPERTSFMLAFDRACTQ